MLDVRPLRLQHVLRNDDDDVGLLHRLQVRLLARHDHHDLTLVDERVQQELTVILQCPYSCHWMTELTESQITRVRCFTLITTDMPRSVLPEPHGSITTPERAM